jgi:hypothetical protein
MSTPANALLSGEPADSSSTPLPIPAGVAVQETAALELEREQHEFQGPMDVVKAMLMWDETTEERVRTKLSHHESAASVPLPSQTVAANRPR